MTARPAALATSSTPRATSVKKGLAMSRTTRPSVRLRPARRWRADSLRTKPRAAIASSTRRRVVSLTVSGRFRTLLTVPTETPACPATSRMLVVRVHLLVLPRLPGAGPNCPDVPRNVAVDTFLAGPYGQRQTGMKRFTQSAEPLGDPRDRHPHPRPRGAGPADDRAALVGVRQLRDPLQGLRSAGCRAEPLREARGRRPGAQVHRRRTPGLAAHPLG